MPVRGRPRGRPRGSGRGGGRAGSQASTHNASSTPEASSSQEPESRTPKVRRKWTRTVRGPELPTISTSPGTKFSTREIEKIQESSSQLASRLKHNATLAVSFPKSFHKNALFFSISIFAWAQIKSDSFDK